LGFLASGIFFLPNRHSYLKIKMPSVQHIMENQFLYKVCLTNDDGPNSAGLRILAYTLNQSMDLVVIVPDSQRSGIGKALTFNHPLRITENEVNGCRQITHSGTPADSVYVAREFAKKIDLFISGINTGANVGYQSMLTSGTVGVVMEAAIQGYPGIAVSRVAESKDWFNSIETEYNFERECKITLELAQHVLEKGLPNGIDALNLNFPIELSDDSEIVVTKPTRIRMRNDLVQRDDPQGSPYYWIRGIETDPKPDTDVYEVLRKKNISISPIIIDSVRNDEIKLLKDFLEY
jgi:5'-nucleotidase